MTDDLQSAMAEFQRCVEHRDGDGASRILHDDFALVLTHPAQAVMPRERWLEVLPDYVVHAYEVIVQTVDVDGDVASVLHSDVMRATVLGGDRSGTFVISDTWRRTAGGWRLWRRHSTPLDAGPMPGVA